MSASCEQVRARVASQKSLLPSLYGQVDFDRMPERFTEDASEAIVKDRAPMGVAMTAYEFELVRAYTMLGDIVADAYAALMPAYSFRQLIDMLREACDHGVEHLDGAPPELVAFIRDMERIPDWRAWTPQCHPTRPGSTFRGGLRSARLHGVLRDGRPRRSDATAPTVLRRHR